MINLKQSFQILSYLQYPLMTIAMFYALKPYLQGFEFLKENPNIIFENYNDVLIFMGLAISFSTLQDTKKTQSNFSKKIWENPKKGQIAILIIALLVLICLSIGIFGYFISDNEKLQQISFGAIVFGIGLIGFLKTAIEMFENHRLDKNTANKIASE